MYTKTQKGIEEQSYFKNKKSISKCKKLQRDTNQKNNVKLFLLGS